MCYTKDEGLPYVTAVLVAAGSSTRMGGNCSKQLIDICGKPVIIHTLMAFEQTECIQDVIIVCRDEDREAIRNAVNEYKGGKVSNIVKGGATRQQSVFCGVQACAKKTDYFAIHDGARAFASPSMIGRTVVDAFLYKAAAAAVPVKDTIKVVDGGGFVKNTPDRNCLWAVQTPQVFEKQLYLSALHRAEEENADYTDDCQLVERMGAKVHLCKGEYSNIKITTLDDVALAEHMLSKRIREQQL